MLRTAFRGPAHRSLLSRTMASSSARVARSVNPATDELVEEHPLWTDQQANQAAERALTGFHKWKKTSFAERRTVMNNAAKLLRSQKQDLARLAAVEMGKALGEGGAEVEKCAALCEYFALRTESMLQPEEIGKAHGAPTAPLPGTKNLVTFQPIGPIFIIMPWNFPYWQVFRQVGPTISAGNTMLLKHASNVFGCAKAIEKLMWEAGFPRDVFQNLPISGAQAENLIGHPAIAGVAVTGSTEVGKKVGAKAGGLIKPVVLELGGSDPYVILGDADLDKAVGASVAGRLLNCGQSCIGAKRFIVVDKVYDKFVEKFSAKLGATVVGNPLQAESKIGPMVNKGAREEIHQQVKKSVASGARVATGGEVPTGKGAFYPPTVLFDVKPGMPAYHEELFGPVASVIRAKDEKDAIRIANDTEFGLGAAVFTEDLARGQEIATKELEAGLCFVNDFVKSHQALPFGGVKTSGIGRECGAYGARAFVNTKTVVVK